MVNFHARSVAVSAPGADVRRGPADRRRVPRGGRRLRDKVRLALFVSCALLASRVASAQAPIGFGFDVNSTARARSLGIPTTYGSIWAGVWNQPGKYGWGGIKTQLQ